MVEGDFVNEQTNMVSLSSNFLCAEHHSAKPSIGDEIFKLLLKILNSDETVDKVCTRTLRGLQIYQTSVLKMNNWKTYSPYL